MCHKPIERPAPVEWIASDASVMSIRPIKPGDVELLRAFVKGMSPGSRYFRYGRIDIDFSEETLRRVCATDAPGCVHLLVVQRTSTAETVVGSGRVEIDPQVTTCELEYAVTDAWQRRGVGTRLLNALVDWARFQGCKEIQARVLATNRGGLQFLRRNGFRISRSEGTWLKIATLAI